MKKVFKFILWGFLVVVGILGITVLATAISGGFNPEKVYITNLTINGQKEYATITQNDGSYTGRVDFLPVNANQLNLTAKIVTGSDVIKEMPAVKAGENFTIEFATEEITDINGDKQTVTKGGEVEIKFVDSSTNAYATLKILVDVGVTANNLKVTSDSTPIGRTGAVSNADSKTKTLNCKVGLATSKLNTIKISTSDNNMINSYKGSWTKSDLNNSVANVDNMKKMLYYNYDKTSIKDLKLETKHNKETGERSYLFTYYSPATTLSTPARLSIYLYRTYYKQTIFSETLWQNITTAIRTGSYSESALNYSDVNSFINTYMYGDCSDSQRECLDKLKNSQNGLINLNPANDFDTRLNALNAVIDYVFVHFNLDITVKNIEIKNIGVINEGASEIRNFSVLMNYKYTVNEMREKFVRLESDAIGTGDDEAVLTSNIRKLDIMVVRKLNKASDAPVNDKGEPVIYFNDADPPEQITDKGTLWNNYLGDTNFIKDKDYFYDEKDQNIVYTILRDNAFLSIKKEIVEGEATWTFKTQVNTPSTSEYYILYKYRNNDISKVKVAMLYNGSGDYKPFVYDEGTDSWLYKLDSNEFRVVENEDEINYLNGQLDENNGKKNQVSITMPDSTDPIIYKAWGGEKEKVTTTDLFYDSNNLSWYYYNNNKDKTILESDVYLNGMNKGLNATLYSELVEILKEKFDDIIAFARFDVTYVESKIELNGGNTEDFVLNSNKVYTMQDNTPVPVEGLNYVSKKIYTTGNNARVVVKPNSDISTAIPEYKTIKWLVKADENKFEVNGKTYYRFLPTMIKTTIEGKETYNPVEITLVNSATGNPIKLDKEEVATTFMELGTNDFTLRALNVISLQLGKNNETITLYPVVIQTLDEKGTPYLKQGSYSAVSMGSGDNTTIKLTATKYIENLYAFCDNGKEGDEKALKNISNTISSDNVLNIPSGITKEIYLSSIQLSYDKDNGDIKRAENIKENITLGEVVCYDENITNMNLLNENPNYDKNMDVIIDAVCYEYSEKVALYNYYLTIKDRWQNKKAYNCEATMGESGQLSEYAITLLTTNSSSGGSTGGGTTEPEPPATATATAPSSNDFGFYLILNITNTNSTVDKGFNLTIYANGQGTSGTRFSMVETSAGGNGVSFSFKLLKSSQNQSTGSE